MSYNVYNTSHPDNSKGQQVLINHADFDERLGTTRGFIFDMDGLMLDTERLSQNAWIGAAKQLGVDMPIETSRKIIGRVSADISRLIHEEMGPDFPIEAYMNASNEVYHQMISESPIPTKTGIKELLEWLKEKNIPRVVATSTRYRIAKGKLDSTGLLPYFDDVIAGDMVTEGKPSPEIFIKAAGLLQLEPVECLVLEDSYNGVRGAFESGALTVMIPDLLPPTEEMMKKAAAIFPSLAEFKTYAVGRLSV